MQTSLQVCKTILLTALIAALTLPAALCRANQVVTFELYHVVFSDGSQAVGTFDYDFTANKASNLNIAAEGFTFDNSANDPTRISKQDISSNYDTAVNSVELLLTYAATLNPATGSVLSLGAASSYLITDTASLTVVSGYVLPVVSLPVTTASFSSTPNANGWFKVPVTLTLNAKAGLRPVAATYYSLDNAPAAAYTAPFLVSGEAAHTLTFWSVDTGQYVETAKTIPVGIDAAPPVTTAYRSGETVTVTGMDAVSGIDAIYYTLNGGSQQTYTSPIIAPVGASTVTYWAVDKAGNAESPHTLTFTATDSVPPTPPGSPYFVVPPGTMVTVVWTASADNVGVAGYTLYRLYGHSGRGGGYSWIPVASTTDTQITTANVGYSYSVKAFDAAGNYSALAGVSTAAPVGTVSGQVQLQSVADASLLPAPLMVKVDFRAPGSTFVIYTGSAALVPMGAGSPNASFTLPNVPQAAYDIALKTPLNLSQVVPRAAVSGDTTIPGAVILPGGDASSDNAVNFDDFLVLLNAFGSSVSDGTSGYDAAADFNYDGIVNFDDFLILLGNYGLTGQ